MDIAKELSAIAIKHGKAAALEMVESVAVQALEQAAKASPTPIDDIVIAALKEPLKKALVDLISKI